MKVSGAWSWLDNVYVSEVQRSELLSDIGEHRVRVGVLNIVVSVCGGESNTDFTGRCNFGERLENFEEEA